MKPPLNAGDFVYMKFPEQGLSFLRFQVISPEMRPGDSGIPQIELKPYRGDPFLCSIDLLYRDEDLQESLTP